MREHLRYSVSFATCAGAKEKNQDALSIQIAKIRSESAAFVILCDGMGGFENGEIASTELVECFADWFRTRFEDLMSCSTFQIELFREWDHLIEREHQKILQYSTRTEKKMGTTLTALLLWKDYAYIMHVGDSRIYKIAPSGIQQLTYDHTKVQQEVEQNKISPEQARTRQYRNLLTQCVGAGKTPSPQFAYNPITPDAIYLICSDGFYHELTETEIREIYAGEKKNDQKNLRRIMRLNLRKGEKDNSTAGLIRIETVGKTLFERWIRPVRKGTVTPDVKEWGGQEDPFDPDATDQFPAITEQQVRDARQITRKAGRRAVRMRYDRQIVHGRRIE